MTSPRPRDVWVIAAAFVISAMSSLGLTVLYALGGQPQLEGALLGTTLGGLAVGLVVWAAALMPNEPITEKRDIEPGEDESREEAEALFETGTATIERRRFLGRLLGVAAAALGAAAVFPIRSLGERPGRALLGTAWRDGSRVVTADGEPVRADDVPLNGFLTVFPEGATDAADSQVVLIRLDPGDAGELEDSSEGFVAFSKICTHAGCPVGLYQAETKELFCPCHQSAFAVTRGATPTSGPAKRALPRLPLRIEDGFLVASGDFSEPVGPGFWGPT
jgi:ubiquinol-cytochrome c reductase iron-sulfur subunit